MAKASPADYQRALRIAFIGARRDVGIYRGIETYREKVCSRMADRGHKVGVYGSSCSVSALPREG